MAAEKKIKAPPVLMTTWVVRYYTDGILLYTCSYPTSSRAAEASEEWLQAGPGRTVEREEVTQERRLRG